MVYLCVATYLLHLHQLVYRLSFIFNHQQTCWKMKSKTIMILYFLTLCIFCTKIHSFCTKLFESTGYMLKKLVHQSIKQIWTPRSHSFPFKLILYHQKNFSFTTWFDKPHLSQVLKYVLLVHAVHAGRRHNIEWSYKNVLIGRNFSTRIIYGV